MVPIRMAKSTGSSSHKGYEKKIEPDQDNIPCSTVSNTDVRQG